MNKVVYNSCYGGFSLSKEAAERLAELDNKEMQESLDMCKDNPYLLHNNYFYGNRHDPLLVQVVEELGEKASGNCADLKIYYLKGNQYRIDEYDGLETVQEPDDYNWILIE